MTEEHAEPEEHVKSEKTEIGFTIPGSFADYEKDRPVKDARIPLKTAIKTELRNGLDYLYTDEIAPVISGEVSYGKSVPANCAILGYRFMEEDVKRDNILARARPPKNGAIDAETVGRCIRSIMQEGLVFEKRSMVAVGKRTRKE